MPATIRFLCAVLILGLLVIAVRRPASQQEPQATSGEEFHPRLQEIAKTYSGYGRVDGSSRWDGTDCRFPPTAVAYVSASDDRDTHGRKLYSIFASHRQEYLRRA